MFEVTRGYFVAAHQEMVMKALYKMTLRGNVGAIATRIERKLVPQEYRVDQIFRKFRAKMMKEAEGKSELEFEEIKDAMGVLGDLVTEAGVSDKLISLFARKRIPTGEGNIVAYTPRLTAKEIELLPKHRQADAQKWNEKMQWFELDADAFTALMGLNQPVGATFMDNVFGDLLLRKPKGMVRFFATDANPLFVAANAVRDILSFPVFNPEGGLRPLSGLTKFIEGAGIVLGSKGKNADEAKSLLMDMYNASGARTSSFFDAGTRRQMRGELPGIMRATRELLQNISDKWRNWMGGPESFIRISEFKRVYEAAKKANKSDVEAGLLALEAAKESTVNFARAGTIARGVNQAIPYFSAGFAGNRRMWRSLIGAEGRGLTDAQRRVAAMMAMGNAALAITAPAFVAWLIHHDEDWYKDLPSWRKEHFINTRIAGQIISFPLPFELGVIAGALPIAVMDYLTDSNPIDAIPTVAGAIFPYFQGGPADILPPLAKATLEAWTGVNLYHYREQTPYWLAEAKAPEDQMRRDTAKAFQGLFKLYPGLFQALGIDNPIELQQAFGTPTAGGVPHLLNMLEDIGETATSPNLGEASIDMMLKFTRRFTGQTPHRSSRSMEEFYERLNLAREQAKRETSTAADRRLVRAMQRERAAMARVRRRRDAGEITREEADRLIFEIANKRTQLVR
jgi:hypothetical protein